MIKKKKKNVKCCVNSAVENAVYIAWQTVCSETVTIVWVLKSAVDDKIKIYKTLQRLNVKREETIKQK